MKLEIKHLAVYAPYNIKVLLGNTKRDLTAISLDSPFIFVTAFLGSRDKQMAGIENIKVYSPSTNITKTFILDYDITNLCVKHNDIGELYYNFIGGEWDVDINNLNIDVYLPNNKEEIYMYVV